MVTKNLRRLGLIATCVYFTYNSHDWIERTLKTGKFFFTRPEVGFVVKDQALDMKIRHELNPKGNLETYVKSYGTMLPVYLRTDGIMVGDADYNFSHFTKGEQRDACMNWMHERGMLKKKTRTEPQKRKQESFQYRPKSSKKYKIFL